ncbi:MAG: transketolase family protein [Syntrophomonadaceae bacterium]|nr:transketolase family protein [Syntrophomonadaceae bacterium]
MKKQATREAYGKALLELGKQHQDIVVLDADLSKSTKTAEFARVFPERFINAGIAEQNMMGMSAGLAAAGKTVFASTFAVFAAGRAFEQIRNSIAYAALDVKICATHAGITVGEDGGSHQSVEDIALMRIIPGMRVVVPADGPSTGQLLEQLYHRKGPAYLRLGRLAVDQVYAEDNKLELDRGVELKIGTEATIVACGIMVDRAIQAWELLSREGISVSVVDMHTIKPLDQELLIKKAKETGAILTVEEHSIIGGLGSAVCEIVSEYYPVPVLRMGIKDQFGQSGRPEELLQHYGLGVEDIVQKVRNLLEIK